MKLIKEDIDKIVRRIFAKQHPLLPEIMINWNKIVGFNFSTKALPLKITTYTYKKQRLIRCLYKLKIMLLQQNYLIIKILF